MTQVPRGLTAPFSDLVPPTVYAGPVLGVVAAAAPLQRLVGWRCWYDEPVAIEVRPAIARHLLPSAAETVERDHVLFVPGLPESSQQVTVHLDPVRFRVEGRGPRAG